MKKLFYQVLPILLILSIGLTSCQKPADDENQSEAFKKYGQEFKGKIAKSYKDSKEWWPTPPKPPEGTPNVVILLLDDTGFGHLSGFGGLCETPNIDKLGLDGTIQVRRIDGKFSGLAAE